MALNNSVGYGIGLGAVPKDYSSIYERGLGYAFANQAKKAKKEDDDWQKYLGLLKPKGDLHQTLVGRNNENYARALSKIQRYRMEQPNSWQMPTEQEVFKANANYDFLKGTNDTIKIFEATPDEKQDPFQRYMKQVLRTAKSTDEVVKAYLADPRSQSPDTGVLMDTDPNSPTYGGITMNGLNPNKNLRQEAQNLLTNEALMDVVTTSRVKGANNSYVDKTQKFFSDKRKKELLGLEFDANADTQTQYWIDNRYEHPEKLKNPRESYINDMLPLAGRKVDATVENIPQGDKGAGGLTDTGKVRFVVSKQKADSLLFKGDKSFPENIGKAGDDLTVVDFAYVGEAHNKPQILYDKDNNPIVAIPKKWIKNERTGDITVVALKAQTKKGIESAVGEKKIKLMQDAIASGDYEVVGGKNLTIPYEKNKEGLAVELDNLTFDYALENGQIGEVLQKDTPKMSGSSSRKKFNPATNKIE